MGAYVERINLSSLGSAYKAIESLVERKLNKEIITSISKKEYEYLKKFIELRQSDIFRKMSRNRLHALAKNIQTAVKQLLKLPIQG